MWETPSMTPNQAAWTRSTDWSLEVVRGRDVGRVFALSGGDVVLGNALNGAAGLDLRDQEAGSPRRMAARQAAVEMRGAEIAIRDLDSPGGTFVNRQRLLAGQSRRLQPGDEIQLGGVLLRVVASGSAQARIVPPAAVPAAAPHPTAPGRLAVPYTIGATVVCRTWDDFLVVAAQRWKDLRDDLESGRLTEYLRNNRSIDLLPRPDAAASPDERLDQWLGRLPVTRSIAPELDVHPAVLEVRSSGGTTRHILKVGNVGYRLLRATARVEPAGASWVRLPPSLDGRPFLTVEQTEVSVEVTVPDGASGPLAAEIVVESNGGTQRVPVRADRPERPPSLPNVAAAVPGATFSELMRPLAAIIGGLDPTRRIAAGAAAVVLLRATVLASGLLPVGTPGHARFEPRLPALALAGAVLGLCIGVLRGRPKADGGPLDAAAMGLAAGLIGILAAAVVHAVVKTVESPLGAWAESLGAVGLLWAIVGAVVAGASLVVLPHRDASEKE